MTTSLFILYLNLVFKTEEERAGGVVCVPRTGSEEERIS